jgi:hypothetical protein
MARKYLMELFPPGAPVPRNDDPRREQDHLRPYEAADLFRGMIARSHSRRRAKILETSTAEMNAAQAYFDARKQAVESCIKARAAEYRLRELPQITSDDERHGQDERGAEQRAMQGRRQLSELRQEIERLDAERGATASRQQLAARRDLGLALEWKKQGIEILDAELGIAERRAVLSDQMHDLGRSNSTREDELSQIDELLHETREQLRASGLDTTRIDEEIARLAKRRPLR